MHNTQKIRSLYASFRKGAVGYIFILPVIIGLAFIYLPSLFRAVMISLSDLSYNPAGMVMEYVGWDQYKYAFTVDPNFVPTMINSVKDLFINVPTIIIFSFFIANLLNQRFVGRSMARMIFFLPVIISTGILFLAESNDTIQTLYAGGGKLDVGGIGNANIFNYQNLKAFFMDSGLNMNFVSLIFATIDRIYYIVTSSGVQILIFLAGLQSIPDAMFEAAKLEGATTWEILWKITFPYISPLILVSVLFTIIETFYSFSNPIVSYINTYLKDPNSFSYGSALSLTYFAIIAVIIGVMCYGINHFIVYQD